MFASRSKRAVSLLQQAIHSAKLAGCYALPCVGVSCSARSTGSSTSGSASSAAWSLAIASAAWSAAAAAGPSSACTIASTLSSLLRLPNSPGAPCSRQSTRRPASRAFSCVAEIAALGCSRRASSRSSSRSAILVYRYTNRILGTHSTIHDSIFVAISPPDSIFLRLGRTTSHRGIRPWNFHRVKGYTSSSERQIGMTTFWNRNRTSRYRCARKTRDFDVLSSSYRRWSSKASALRSKPRS
jgi:hypothetical protein